MLIPVNRVKLAIMVLVLEWTRTSGVLDDVATVFGSLIHRLGFLLQNLGFFYLQAREVPIKASRMVCFMDFIYPLVLKTNHQP